MAGDWIKVEHATLDKPEVTLFAELLGVTVDDGLGKLMRFWVWLDKNSRNGRVTHVSRLSIDTVMHCNGFGAGLERVGWLKFNDADHTAHVPNFDRHNSSSAKSRANNARRQQRFRNARVTVARDKSVTREEKRRVLKNTCASPVGFAEFWRLYPRKKSKGSAEKAWRTLAPDAPLQARISTAIAAARAGRDWQRDAGAFIPYPASWLNARGWEDEGAPIDLEAERLRRSGIG